MTPVVRLLEVGLLAWFGALALLVVIRILRDEVPAGGMLVSASDRDSVDPERVVTMTVVPAVFAFYTIHAIDIGLVKTSTGSCRNGSGSGLSLKQWTISRNMGCRQVQF